MNRSKSDCYSLYTEQMYFAEKELFAFRAAVAELFGREQARFSGHDWLSELESINGTSECTSHDWRAVTIAASARLASRLKSSLPLHASPRMSGTNTKVLPIPTSNCPATEGLF
jgi:hypothetical protein